MKTRLYAAALCAAVLPLLSGARVTAAPGDAVPVTLNWALTPDQIGSLCDTQIAKTKAAHEALYTMTGPRTFDNTVLAGQNVDETMHENLATVYFLSSVAVEKPVRDAANACIQKVSAFSVAESTRPNLYAIAVAVEKSGTATTDAQKTVMADMMRGLKRSGADRDPQTRAKIAALTKQLGDDMRAFRRNISEDTRTIVMTQAQTAGVPADYLATLKKNPDGSYVLPVNEQSIALINRVASDATLRKNLTIAYYEGVPANLPVMKRVIAERDALAKTLGYKTWADYVLADRMAGSVDRVNTFLAQLDAKLLPRSRQELAVLASLKAKDLGVASATIEPWDVSYYHEKLRAQKVALDTQAVRKFFPVSYTIPQILDIYQTVLGVKFTEATPANVYAPQVSQYHVNDAATNAYIGDFYLDLYPRPGKYDHFANFGIVGERKLPDGTRRAAVYAIVGNWTPPAPGQPALLAYDEVNTFFHEFGHNMAGLLSTVPYGSLGGYKRDFVEAPSQMLENWLRDPAVLKKISKNTETGQPLDDATIAKMVAADNIDQGLLQTRQIAIATYDMMLHTSGPNADPDATWAKAVTMTTASPMLTPDNHYESRIGHFVGYDAGYYGYLWSRVYAQDMFTQFQGHTLDPVVGMRYRKEVLEPGETYPADVLVARFLGRPMKPDAFYHYLGIN